MATSFPPLPPVYKSIQHFTKTASEHDKRDPVVAYWCMYATNDYENNEEIAQNSRFYALQKAMEIDKKSPECRQYLMAMMDCLEAMKKEYADKEAISNEIVGQAHMENYALKLFLYADNEDRAGRFGKNVVKSFYTSHLLFEVLGTFGEISEDNGETPIPGPMPEGEEQVGGAQGGGPTQGAVGWGHPGGSVPPHQTVPSPSGTNYLPTPQPGAHAPPTTPLDPPPSVPQPTIGAVQITDHAAWQPPANPEGITLTPADYQKAMKYCKYASSSLQYEDSKTAIENLSKALKLLTTGHE